MKLACIFLLCAGLRLSAQDAPRPKVLGLAHISLYAHDYERSKAFYREFLGFEEPYSLKNADGSPSMTFFKINDEQFIELSPERAPDTDRLNHYALETDNAEAMRRYLATRGVTVPDHTPKGRIGNLNFTIKDPEGHSVEIVEYPPDGQTSRTRGQFISANRISQHLKHVGVIVTDLSTESQFYTDVLGFTEIWRGSAANSKTLSWVNLKVPDGADYVEFMLYKEAPAMDKRGTAHHLSLEVSDVDLSVAKLNATPYRRQYARAIEIHTGINRKRQVNLFDSDGTRTELMEPHTIDGEPAEPSKLPPPNASERPPITGLAHVGFFVSDTSKADEFYGHVLGFGQFSLDKPAGGPMLTYYKVNDHQYIEIYPGLQGDDRDRLSTVAFETTDARKMRDYLESKGVKAPQSLKLGPDKNLSFMVSDPEGRRIEFVQYMPGSLHSSKFGTLLPDTRVSDHMIHAGFIVHDRAAEDRFYKDILGFKVMWYGGMKDDQVNWVDMRVPEGSDWLEYMLNVNNPSPKTRGVMNHFALGVKDIHTADNTILGRLSKPPEQPKIGRDGKWQLNLYDPDLTRVELMEFKPVETPCCSPMLTN